MTNDMTRAEAIRALLAASEPATPPRLVQPGDPDRRMRYAVQPMYAAQHALVDRANERLEDVA